jgi:Cd2+/Zn2+-exporting ATPase
MNSRTWKLKNLDCADCAAKVEHAVASIPGVKDAQVDFLHMRMSVTADGDKDEAFWRGIEKIAKRTEGELDLREMDNGVCPYCNHEHCVCGVIEEKRKFDLPLCTIIVSLVLFLLSFLLRKEWIALIAYAVAGYDVVWSALKNIFKGKLFDEHFLMAVASIGAIFLKDYREAAAVMIFYQVGEYFQDKAVDSSRRHIADMMDLKSDTATVVKDGKERVVRSEDVSVGEIVKVKNGEKIPLDGIIVSGTSFLDTKSLTGEPVPRKVAAGDPVVSGCVNTESVLLIKVEKEYKDSTVKQILTLVEDASDRKAKSEQFITRFARYYTPAVVFSALALAVIPSLVTGSWSVWIYRALVFLVISCPCALVISVPLSYFAGIGSLAKIGVLVKGSNYLQTLSECRTIVFDKTGTVTEGTFKVRHTDSFQPYDKEQVMEAAGALEAESVHPIAKAIVSEKPSHPQAENVREIAGKGIVGVLNGKSIACGNEKLLDELGVRRNDAPSQGGSVVYVVIEGRHAGTIVVSDKVKENARETMERLHKDHVALAMLTGDEKRNAEEVAHEVGMDILKAGLLPADKVDKFEILKESGKTAYVGDGINDAPVLSLSDCGIAMGAMGSDAAINASDIVIMTDDISRVADTFHMAKRTSLTVKENIVFALSVKAVILLLGALGIAGMWLAVFADVGVAMIAILNSLRLFLVKSGR